MRLSEPSAPGVDGWKSVPITPAAPQIWCLLTPAPKTRLRPRRTEAVQANADWWWWSGAFWRRRQLLEALNGWSSLNNRTDSQEGSVECNAVLGLERGNIAIPLQVSWISMARSHNDPLLPVDELLYGRTKWLGAVESLGQWMKFL